MYSPGDSTKPRYLAVKAPAGISEGVSAVGKLQEAITGRTTGILMLPDLAIPCLEKPTPPLGRHFDVDGPVWGIVGFFVGQAKARGEMIGESIGLRLTTSIVGKSEV